MTIKNQDDWWDILYENQDNIIKMIEEYHPTYEKTHNMSITAPDAEVVCQQIRENISQNQIEDPVSAFQRLIKEKDGISLTNLLNEIWFGVPESRDAFRIPGFGDLCDLCSESWVFYEEEE